MKTTNVPGLKLQFYNAVRADFVPVAASLYRRPGMIMDGRNLPVAQLDDLYNSSHAFLLTSCGEGWGQTLTEAMATGAPCVWTHWSAPHDYADSTIGFPLTNFKMIPYWREGREVGVGEPDYYGAAATDESIIQRMEQIYHDYNRALKIGKKASERMHACFRWSDAALKFIKICEKYI